MRTDAFKHCELCSRTIWPFTGYNQANKPMHKTCANLFINALFKAVVSNKETKIHDELRASPWPHKKIRFEVKASEATKMRLQDLRSWERRSKLSGARLGGKLYVDSTCEKIR